MPREPGRLVAFAGVCLLAVACAGRAEAAEWRALPVAGGLEALARAAGLGPGLPAWRVMYEACRRRHGVWGDDGGSPARPPTTPGPGGVVPLPLAPGVWRGLLPDGGSLPDEGLAVAILADRRSALLYRGLAGFDEPTLAALAAAPEVLRRIQRRHADLLAVFGVRFTVREGTAVVPGGAAAEAAWQSVVGESPSAPADFLLRLLEQDDGRLAFLYDSLARLDPERQRRVLGLAGQGSAGTESVLRGLLAVFRSEPAWWHVTRGAFARPEADAARVLREVRLGEDGGVAAPASRAFWEAVFDGRPLASQDLRGAPPADLAWLAARVCSGDARQRSLRFEQLTFAQRVFGAAAEAQPAAAVRALASLAEMHALVLALERFGVRDPAFVADTAEGVRAALAYQGRSDALRAAAQPGLQGALAVVDRARFNGTLDTEGASRLVSALVLALGPLPAERRGLGHFVEARLLPALASATGEGSDPDETVLRAMAGDVRGRPAGRVLDWEGLDYRAQPERAELLRLRAVRRRQGGASLKQTLAACRSSADGESCATGLGQVLTSLAYAASLGAPEGPALRGEDPSRRHAFQPEPWALPTEATGPGIPWHVEGSLLGLEAALARLSLHRLDADALPDELPAVDQKLRQSLAESVGLANTVELHDRDRDSLAAAVAAGRRRAAALAPGSADLAAAERDAGLDPWRARSLEWLLEHEPDALASFFSLAELAYLGEPRGGSWDGWGASDPLVAGLGLRFPPPRPLDESAGRLPEPALGESFVDVGVRVAVHLAERGLPASLSKAVAAALLPDLFLEAHPVAPGDRLGLDAWVRELKPERLDDAVASLVGRGPLQPAGARSTAP